MKLKELSIATFNLYNLNIPSKKIYADPNGWTQDEYDKKIAWTASQLRLLQADVIGFQELWHVQCMQDALTKANLTNEYDVLAPQDATGKHIVCAAIVRKGLQTGQADWISDFPSKFVLKAKGGDAQTPKISVAIDGFSRPVLHFKIKPRDDSKEIDFYVCHFKSKGPTKVFNEQWYKDDAATYAKQDKNLGSAISTIRRTAEASALRFILTEHMKQSDTPVVVLGDMNDAQHSNTANILTEQPTYLDGEILGGSDIGLYTTQMLQEFRDTRDVYYTHVHNGVRESLDQILVSQEFYDHSKKRIWFFKDMIVNNDHLNFDTHKENGTGDHGIIRASFKYKPA